MLALWVAVCRSPSVLLQSFDRRHVAADDNRSVHADTWRQLSEALPVCTEEMCVLVKQAATDSGSNVLMVALWRMGSGQVEVRSSCKTLTPQGRRQGPAQRKAGSFLASCLHGVPAGSEEREVPITVCTYEMWWLSGRLLGFRSVAPRIEATGGEGQVGHCSSRHGMPITCPNGRRLLRL